MNEEYVVQQLQRPKMGKNMQLIHDFAVSRENGIEVPNIRAESLRRAREKLGSDYEHIMVVENYESVFLINRIVALSNYE